MPLGTPWANTKQTASALMHSIDAIMDASGEVAFRVEDLDDDGMLPFSLDKELVAGVENLADMHQRGEAPLHVNLPNEVRPIKELADQRGPALEAFLGEERYEDFSAKMSHAYQVLGIEEAPKVETTSEAPAIEHRDDFVPQS